MSTEKVEGYRVSELARITGRSPDAIRLAERRLGLTAPRTSAGDRRFSAEQAAQIVTNLREIGERRRGKR
jgi:DNA-binding transcriptional MerR regulator